MMGPSGPRGWWASPGEAWLALAADASISIEAGGVYNYEFPAAGGEPGDLPKGKQATFCTFSFVNCIRSVGHLFWPATLMRQEAKAGRWTRDEKQSQVHQR